MKHALAGGAAAMLLASPAFANAVVIRATGPDAARFPVGQVLARGTAISLQRGSVLGLIDKAGSWELRGVVKTRIGKRPVETTSRLRLMQDLVRKRQRIRKLAAVAAVSPRDSSGSGVRTARTAAVRDSSPRPAAAPAARPAPVDAAWWQYPLGEGGTFCLVDGQGFELARPSGAETDVVFREDGTSRTLTYRFGTNAEIAYAAPTDIPTGGKTYSVALAGGSDARVRFVAIAPPRDSVALARALAANGCLRQIEALSRESVSLDPPRP